MFRQILRQERWCERKGHTSKTHFTFSGLHEFPIVLLENSLQLLLLASFLFLADTYQHWRDQVIFWLSKATTKNRSSVPQSVLTFFWDYTPVLPKSWLVFSLYTLLGRCTSFRLAFITFLSAAFVVSFIPTVHFLPPWFMQEWGSISCTRASFMRAVP